MRKIFATEFGRVCNRIAAEASYLKDLGRDVVRNAVMDMLRFGALCTKHHGFHEELEWRAIAWPSSTSVPLLRETVEVVRGVPQRVRKIELRDHPDLGVRGLALPDVLDRVIVGPCKFPHVTSIALYQVLLEAGVPDPGDRIVVSDIPLRYDEWLLAVSNG